jgi:hypothetical protein
MEPFLALMAGTLAGSISSPAPPTTLYPSFNQALNVLVSKGVSKGGTITYLVSWSWYGRPGRQLHMRVLLRGMPHTLPVHAGRQLHTRVLWRGMPPPTKTAAVCVRLSHRLPSAPPYTRTRTHTHTGHLCHHRCCERHRPVPTGVFDFKGSVLVVCVLPARCRQLCHPRRMFQCHLTR